MYQDWTGRLLVESLPALSGNFGRRCLVVPGIPVSKVGLAFVRPFPLPFPSVGPLRPPFFRASPSRGRLPLPWLRHSGREDGGDRRGAARGLPVDRHRRALGVAKHTQLHKRREEVDSIAKL